jgi:anthranilate phosphoribosyltransferase
VGVAPDALTALAVATDQACQTLADLLRATAGGGLTDRPRLVLTHTGALLVLTGYCTSHHRGKHQAPGWRHQMAPDGTLTVTTPTGLVAATTPPPY